MSQQLQLATTVVERAQALGASEVSATVSSGSHVTLLRRGGQVEQATEATTQGLVVSLLADDRYTSNSTSDLRPEAIESFLKRCIESTHYLEPDPDRAFPPADLCGRGASESALDQRDPAWATRTAQDRSELAEALETAIQQRHPDTVISSAAYSADGSARIVRVMSNGFTDETEGCWYAKGGEMTLHEGDKRPEASAYFAGRYLTDLPDVDALADEVVRRARERLGAGPIASGTYPMILENRVAGRLLGVLGGAMSAGAIHHGRSFLAGKVGEQIGSDRLTLLDDPTLPRGLASRPWDRDALVARPRTMIDAGRLVALNVDVYYGRKLDLTPTSGSRSNWIVPPGDRHWRQIAAAWPQAILVTGFLGGNANGTTGDFSFGIRGVLIEHGEPTQSLAEMNVSGNAVEIFHRLVEVDDTPWRYSSCISPALVFEDVEFSGL